MKERIKYWSEYPLLNARINGNFNEQGMQIVIAVNWYESDNENPFYAVWIEPRNQYLELMRQLEGNPKFNGKDLCFYLDPDDFDLERDFNQLLDDFVGIFKKAE